MQVYPSERQLDHSCSEEPIRNPRLARVLSPDQQHLPEMEAFQRRKGKLARRLVHYAKTWRFSFR